MIGKAVVTWSGFTGSPGYSTFYFSNAQEAVFQPGLVTFFDGIKTQFPAAISFSIPNAGMKLDEATGETVGTWQAGTTTTINGTNATGAWASTSGAVCRWDTAQFRRGHRVRGRAFLVPLATPCYTTGTLTTTCANTIQTAGTGLLGKSLVVWHRPLLTKNADGTTSVKEAGEALAPTTCVVPTKVAYLSQRRD